VEITKGDSSVLKKLRVLVVDDQSAVCDVVSDTIQYAGHDVVGTARDGVEAVAQAERLRPDVVVMDVSMPRMTGVEAMKSILAAGTARWVMLMSGEYHSLGLRREDMLRHGASAFLEKPFNVDELCNWLQRWAKEMGRG
jgi:two-component system chemotaxis response regulator CheY